MIQLSLKLYVWSWLKTPKGNSSCTTLVWDQLEKRAEMGRVSSLLFTIIYCAFFQPLGLLSSLFHVACVFRIVWCLSRLLLWQACRGIYWCFLEDKTQIQTLPCLCFRRGSNLSPAHCPHPHYLKEALNHHTSPLQVKKKNPKVCLWVFININFPQGSSRVLSSRASVWSCAGEEHADKWDWSGVKANCIFLWC